MTFTMHNVEVVKLMPMTFRREERREEREKRDVHGL